MQMYRTYILRGLSKKYPQLKVKNLAFRLKNTDVKLHDISVDENKSEVSDNRDREKNLSEKAAQKKMEVDQNLAPELRERFEKLKASLLTKNQ